MLLKIYRMKIKQEKHWILDVPDISFWNTCNHEFEETVQNFSDMRNGHSGKIIKCKQSSLANFVQLLQNIYICSNSELPWLFWWNFPKNRKIPIYLVILFLKTICAKIKQKHLQFFFFFKFFIQKSDFLFEGTLLLDATRQALSFLPFFQIVKAIIKWC